MSKKIAIIGAKGQLGSSLVKILSEKNEYKVLPLTHNDIEVAEKDSIKKCLDGVNPNILINTAAYVQVDNAETNQIEAFKVNALANQYLASYCKNKKIKFVFIGTDYIFGRDKKRTKPYTEDDNPGPINTYGITKLAGEYYTQSLCSNYLIVRSSGIFGVSGSSGKGGNFIETMLTLAREHKPIQVVNDQITSPTYSLDLARQIFLLIDKDENGIFHAVSKGSCSWFEFAQTIFALTKTVVNLKSITSNSYKTPATRPHFSALENKKLEEKNINIMRPWIEGLRAYLVAKGYV